LVSFGLLLGSEGGAGAAGGENGARETGDQKAPAGIGRMDHGTLIPEYVRSTYIDRIWRSNP